MATYYVDPAAAGANNGFSWTDAWTDVQTAFDTAVAGDTVYCRGTQTLTVKIDADTNAGDYNTNGHISFIGCNASGVNDGTRFVLDGNNAAANCLYSSKDYIWVENFEFKNATNAGFESATSTYRDVFINCSFNNNGGDGAYIYGSYGFKFLRCVSYSNGSDGFHLYSGANPILFFCRAKDNTAYGVHLHSHSGAVLIGCIVDHNGQVGLFKRSVYDCIVFNCIINANNDGGFEEYQFGAYGSSIFIGNRITNHDTAGDIGFDSKGAMNILGWNYFENNDGDNIQNGSLVKKITYGGSDTNIEDQSDTNQGYTDTSDPEDYNLSSNATLRRAAITIPED